MGASGYTGLRTLGQVPITVAGRTSSHPAMISEEAHFDVVLGRSWIERMNVKCVTVLLSRIVSSQKVIMKTDDTGSTRTTRPS
jgi:hypothetical protein